MPIIQCFARQLRVLVPAVCLLIASAAVGFAQDSNILPTAGSSCVTCPIPGCCPTDPTNPTDPLNPTDPTNPTDPLNPIDPEFAFSSLPSSLTTPDTIAFTAGGYIDNAVPQTMLRVRFDASYRINHADRAEFLYSTWRAFGGKTPNPPQGSFDGSINTQQYVLYYEYALNSNASVFAEVQAISTDPSRAPNQSGFGDTVAGFKWVLQSNECSILTFQLKNYIPTGSEDKWLTAGHYSIEPGLLYARQLSRRTTLIAELRDWISVDGAEFRGDNYAGNVLRYGAGLTYQLVDNCNWRATPIVELVGWSVLDGLLLTNPSDAGIGGVAPIIGDATGDTIVNLKLGTRFEFGQRDPCNGGYSNSVYVGWGRSLTNDRWYEDILRVEYRVLF